MLRRVQERRIGFHTSIAGGVQFAIERAKALGCRTLQIFSHNPRGWAVKGISKNEADEFVRLRKLYDIDPVFVHTSYLINLASSKSDIYSKSIKLMVKEMELAEMLGADYVVLHPGSSSDSEARVARQRIIKALRTICAEAGGNAKLLLENTAGERGDLTSRIEDLAEIIQEAGATGRSALIAGICLDTCHAFQAGYDIRSEKGVGKMVREIEKYIGIKNLKLIHLNDSKRPFNSRVDRHEHIGKGFIGKEGFKIFLNHPSFRDIPLILETPKENEKDDIRNLRTVKSLF